MVEISPFKGLIYNLDRFKDISLKLAPPYDTISSEQRDTLAKQDNYNIVRLTLPEKSQKDTKYNIAKQILDRWINEGILIFDNEECFYVFTEEFTENNEKKNLTGFIGLLNIEEYSSGKVLRHEKTLKEPREDRLKLIKKTRTNFEFIYTIYNDSKKSVSSIIESFISDKPLISTPVKYDSSLFFKIWRINENSTINKIKKLMKDKNILIADGHHRYETAKLYKKISKNRPELKSPEDYIISLFVSSKQKDLLIHPTHRFIRFKEAINIPEIFGILDNHFIIKKFKNPTEKNLTDEMRSAAGIGIIKILIYFGYYDCYLLTLKKSFDDRNIKKTVNKKIIEKSFNNLEVSILHNIILRHIKKSIEIQEIKFFHSINSIIDQVERYQYVEQQSCQKQFRNAGFIINPPTIDTVEKLANAGMLMPQKSTYFYPKPCSGLVIYKFDTL